MKRAHVLVLAGTVVVALATMGAVSSTTVRAPRHPCTAAVALRDHVPVEQKLGTEAFTVPLLHVGYDRVTYLTANEHDRRRDDVVEALRDAAEAKCTVDLFFLAHGDDFVSWVAAMPEEERPWLRLVYDTGAGDARQGQEWLDVGARAFVGHPGANLAPVFYAFFLPAWIGGATLEDAVGGSNAKTFVVIDSARPYLGDDTGPLWRGTRAQLFGDPTLTRAR